VKYRDIIFPDSLFSWTVSCDVWQCTSQCASYAGIGNVTSDIRQMQKRPFIIGDVLTRMGFASWPGGPFDVCGGQLDGRRRLFVCGVTWLLPTHIVSF
jgi:hypothetical protein